MALSLEKMPTAAASPRAASHAPFRAPMASTAFRWHSSPASTANAASKSDRPTMLVTDSVNTGASPHSALNRTAAGVRLKIASPKAYTSAMFTACSRKLRQ